MESLKFPVTDEHADHQKECEKIAGAGRKRRKIENEGFNRQKNRQGDITHACGHDATARRITFRFYGKVEIGELEAPRQAIMEFTLQCRNNKTYLIDIRPSI